MKAMIIAVALSVLMCAACSGEVAGEPTGSATAGQRTVQKTMGYTGSAASWAMSCEAKERLVAGGCAAERSTIVADVAHGANGWFCDVRPIDPAPPNDTGTITITLVCATP